MQKMGETCPLGVAGLGCSRVWNAKPGPRLAAFVSPPRRHLASSPSPQTRPRFITPPCSLCRTQGNPVANGPIFNRVVVMTNSRNKLLSKCGSVATDDVDLHGTTSKLFEILSSWGLLHVGVCWGTKMEQESHCVRKRGERSGRLWRDKREGKLHQHQRGLGLPTTSSTLFFSLSLSFYPPSLSLHRNSRKCAYPIHLAQNTRHTPLPIRYLCQHGVSMTRLSTALSENSSRPLDNGRPSGKLTFVRRTQSF